MILSGVQVYQVLIDPFRIDTLRIDGHEDITIQDAEVHSPAFGITGVLYLVGTAINSLQKQFFRLKDGIVHDLVQLVRYRLRPGNGIE